MGHFYFLSALGGVVLFAFIMSLRTSVKRRLQMPYVADTTLLTSTGRTFKGVLERAIGPDYQIFAKVHVIDVIGLRRRLSRRDQERALLRIGNRRFDFLICSPETTAILCAVNLAPRSRLRKQPPKDVLDRICAAAGLPFVRFREKEVYSVVEIEERIFAAMQSCGVRPKTHQAPEEKAAVRGALLLGKRDERPSAVRSPSIAAKAAGTETCAAAGIETQSPQRTPTQKRRDPRLSDKDQHIVDDGPSFRINADLGDEKAARSQPV